MQAVSGALTAPGMQTVPGTPGRTAATPADGRKL